MRLASDAMIVPSPPIFTPINSAFPLSVKPESITAAGTLLITCDNSADTISSRPVSIPEKKLLTASIRAMFPTNTKKHTNVQSSG